MVVMEDVFRSLNRYKWRRFQCKTHDSAMMTFFLVAVIALFQ
jgi:hypothetical protein